MHLFLAVNYYVHYPFTSPVNPNGKVKSIANTWPFNVYFRASQKDESARYALKHV
ncbi:transposase [Pseudomonas sp. IT-P74]